MATRISGKDRRQLRDPALDPCDGGVEAFAHIGAFGDFVLDGHHAFDPGHKTVERGDLGGVEDGAAQRDDAVRDETDAAIAVELSDDLADAHGHRGILRGVGVDGDRAVRLSVAGLRMDRRAE
jgi:hypothetical protein